MKEEELIELNVKVRELKREGDFEEIRKIAQEKGISEDKIADFILGELFILDDEDKSEDKNSKESEEIPEVQVVVPFYKSVEEKLEQEQEILLKDVKEETQKVFIKSQLKVMIDLILADEDLKAKAFQSWKELTRCYKNMTDKAQEYALNGVACVHGDVITEWIKEYYNLDDREAVEKERIKKVIAAKKVEEQKAEAKAKKKTTRKRKTKAEKEAEEKAKKEAVKNVKEATEKETVESLGEVKNDVESVADEAEEFDIDESIVSDETVNTSL